MDMKCLLAVVVFAACCLMSSVSTALARSIILTDDGASDYVIILSAEAGESEKFAASELAEHLRRISGAELPIRAEGGVQPARAVYVGYGQAVKNLGVEIDLAALGADGFVLRSVGDNLVIAGGRTRGTLYGVYELLERIGVRWWTPWETFLPDKATVELSEAQVNDAQVPVLDYRDMMYGEIFGAEGRLWAARNKINGFAWDDAPAHLGGRYKFVGNLVHSYMGLLNEGAVDGVKPEMLALVNGKRQGTQPCLTCPEVLEAITRAVVKKYAENPDARFVVVGQNDNRGYCRCENCQAIMDTYHAPSGVVVWFANRVLAEVRKQVPEANICTAAYEWSRKPPVGIKPADGVYITLCSIECDFAHPLATGQTEVNQAFRDDIVAWGKLAEKIYIWDYTPNFHCFLMPHPNFDVLAENIRFFAENSAAGVFEQGSHTTKAAEFSSLRMWVLAKCLWNPKLDGAKLIDEYIEGYYGPAAEAIKSYVEIIHEPVRRNPDYVMRCVMEPSAIYCAPDVLARGNAALARAELAVADEPAYLRRVRQVRLAPWAMILKAGPDSNTFAAASEAVNGELDYAATAAMLIETARDWSVTRYGEHYAIGPWLAWLGDYARAVSDVAGPIPDEAPADARVIQAGQTDSKLDKLTLAEGASDGWAMVCDTNAWLYRKYFTTFDDIAPATPCKLYIRIQARLKPAAEGGASEPLQSDKAAFMAGIRSSGGHKTLNLKLSQLTPGQWQVFEVADWTPRENDYMFFALAGGSPVSDVLVDCMWIQRQ